MESWRQVDVQTKYYWLSKYWKNWINSWKDGKDRGERSGEADWEYKFRVGCKKSWEGIDRGIEKIRTNSLRCLIIRLK